LEEDAAGEAGATLDVIRAQVVPPHVVALPLQAEEKVLPSLAAPSLFVARVGVKGEVRPAATAAQTAAGNSHGSSPPGRFCSLLNLQAGDDFLDIGAADGHLSFLFERLGYEVEAIDHPATNYNWMNGIRQLAAYFNSSVRIHDINIDVWPYPPSGQYAFAMLLGILYHLRNPFCVLENLARRSPYLFMSTRLLSTLLTDLLPLPAVYLAGRTEINFDPTNYWLFTRRSIRRLLTRAGWEILSEYTERTRSAPFALSPSTRDERIYILARSAFTAQFAAFQCLDGWYPIEDGALRWTRREFAVRLHAAHQASRLVFEFFAHPYLLAQGPVTLQTRLEGAELNSYIIAKAGMHKAELSCVIEPNRSYAVAFALSGAIDEPGGERELGVRVEVFNTDHFGRPTPPPLRFE
jgi:SAM-dependent methyltransferase